MDSFCVEFDGDIRFCVASAKSTFLLISPMFSRFFMICFVFSVFVKLQICFLAAAAAAVVAPQPPPRRWPLRTKLLMAAHLQFPDFLHEIEVDLDVKLRLIWM